MILTPWDGRRYFGKPYEQDERTEMEQTDPPAPQPLIITEYVRPPVPSTKYDWMAYIRGEEEGPTGRGPTECEALRDLCEQLAVLWLEEAFNEV